MQSGCCWNTTRRRSGSTTSIGARRSSADLRSKYVALTEKGGQFARTWIDRVPEAETAALGAMPEEECAAFVRGLHLFCRLLEEGFRENGAI